VAVPCDLEVSETREWGAKIHSWNIWSYSVLLCVLLSFKNKFRAFFSGGGVSPEQKSAILCSE
jgi:hypothetical protein